MMDSALNDLETSKSLAGNDAYFFQKEKYKKLFQAIVEQHRYLANIFQRRHMFVLNMNDLEYDTARKIGKEGLDLATDGLMYCSPIMTKATRAPLDFRMDTSFFTGGLKEIDAYEKLDDKRFWEIESEELLETARLFDDSTKELENAAATPHDREVLVSIPEAWSSLLKFMAKPSLNGLQYLAKFKQLEQLERVKRQFGPLQTSKISRRAHRAAAMGAFLRNNVIKVACWNIFGELHYNVNIVETCINEKENKEFLREMLKATDIPRERLSEWEGRVTYERAIDDLDNHMPFLLPQTLHKKEKSSLLAAKELYYYCKHEKIQTDLYSAGKNEFAERFIQKVLQNYESLLALNLDRKRFLETIRKHSV